jgi:predicted RND superfamily exporter protein
MKVVENCAKIRSVRDQSQSKATIGFVLVATYIMFSILLGSTVLGLIGILPNLVAPMGVLGFMGYAGIPLDMMTITIAAVVVGIGVDDAIHYLHRFKAQRATGATVYVAIQNSHGSIGRAMYFTSLKALAMALAQPCCCESTLHLTIRISLGSEPGLWFSAWLMTA